MKNNIFKLFALFILGLTAVGCDDDEEQIFEGIDNRIASFVLTATDGTEYHAAIVDNQIIVSAPDNVSLENATAQYVISEQAILYPDPSTVKDWDSEHRFRVMAYNQTLRDYAYSVRRTPVNSESVTLHTQADVEQFAKEGVTVIEGNLIIGDYSTATSDPIVDLSPLFQLADVRYDIVINNSFAGEEVSFPLLKRVGGLVIGTAQNPAVMKQNFSVELSSVESIGRVSVFSPKITKLSLPEAQSMSSLNMDVKVLEELNLPLMKTCAGDFIMVCGSGTANANKALRELSLPSMETIEGSVTIENYASISKTDFSLLKSVGGNFNGRYLSLVDGLKFPELVYIGGRVELASLSNMAVLSFPKLTKMGALHLQDYSSDTKFSVFDVPVLEQVGDEFSLDVRFTGEELSLPELKTVGGKFEIKNFNLLKVLDIPQLSVCGKDFYLYSLRELKSLDLSKIEKLNKLTIVSCFKLSTIKVQKSSLWNVELNGGSSECELPYFEGAERINGQLYITNYSRTEEFVIRGLKYIDYYKHSSGVSGGKTTITLPDLEECSTFEMTSASWLKKLSAPRLRKASELFSITYPDNMNAGSLDLPVLTTVGKLSLMASQWQADRQALESLDDFSALTSLNEVEITYFAKLADFSGLKNAVAGMTANHWKVQGCRYNPTLEDMLQGRYTE